MKRAVWACLLAMVWATLVRAEEITFTVNPSAVVEQRLKARFLITVAGERASEPPVYQQVRDQELRLLVTPEAAGWQLRLQPVSSRLTINGVVQPDPSYELFAKFPLGFVFNAQGVLEQIQGLEGLLAAFQNPSAGTTLPKDYLEGSCRQIWNEGVGGKIIGRLAGQRVSADEAWERVDDIGALEIGITAPQARGRWMVVPAARTRPGEPVRVSYSYRSDDHPLEETQARAAAGWLAPRLPQLAEATWTSLRAVNVGEAVVQPATLNCTEWRDLTQLTLLSAAPVPRMIQVEIQVALATLD
jgi:hypothetical protein